MPIYEYWCRDCRRISSHLVLNAASFKPYCNHCGGERLKKLISRVHVRLSEETRLERLADPALLGNIDENDPKSMMKMLRKMEAAVGEDLGEDLDQMMEEVMETEQGQREPVELEDSGGEVSAEASKAVRTQGEDHG
ncbi:FmdB family zinc ribbon protein [Thermosulfuriphilus sp.]